MRRVERFFPEAPFLFENASQSLEQNLIHNASKIYFLGIFSLSFSNRAKQIAESLDNFRGLIGGKGAKKSHNEGHYAELSKCSSDFEIVSMDMLPKSADILIVDFNDDDLGLYFTQQFCNQNKTISWVRALHDLGLGHSCQPLRQDRDLLWKRLDNYCELPPLLADTLSFEVLKSRVYSLLSLDLDYLRNYQTHGCLLSSLIRSNAATEGIVSLGMDEAFIDIGAYDGDTVRQFFNITRGKYDSIWAFEPDPKSFESLKNLCNVIPNAKAIQAAVSNKASEVEFVAQGTMGSHLHTSLRNPKVKPQHVKAVTLDDTIDRATFLKIDVEGHELSVLKGGSEIIAETEPSMHISAYHYPQDIPDLVLWLHENQSKPIYLRHQSPNFYDTNIIVS